ncbi:hypothetical protein Ae706Ps2_6069c [Pseudonocardia sp. Ae706_Ps2]|uniref:HTH domain-containing protein n=1 Tax=unclassified Pseudonocardia TaxID=2619320 RepID=UPI00094F2A41|nr:HTH domain-containing protein [Pseudonocardia sp. Ae706_Ps2]OLM08785.1 hypothetical protein Ae706Ps2_6630c [Pseudonocardia sp. Ae706_Ps2]OLM08788.1 hypothetical protein Ae706Ps2_6633c [Pseudonocardia sp. Ae706_Ps2]OLM08791.1 hypothetical protein Ae706Ps2_6636c [Pseudonocardia sp. Ae706_Ps2]OLM08797.1 hypothetical protein Ae706Ps2_6642c [Pseudonocardia sp. Ae706_Ps2]OLM08800.1 hypothetical protein Ae706Ps2_6645c [Pseudonocardia sp. Ae706_Ps2]
MTAQISERRTKTGRELAEKFGVSRSTIVRTIAEPRADYERRARQRRTAVVQLRLQGLTYREIAARTGTTTGIVGRVLAQARHNGEWDAAATHYRNSHRE